MTENNNPATGRAIHWAKTGLIALCLLAPSAWMISTIPPLWRDADAYVQLTQDPRLATYWGHAPAYCYVAKIPLYLGEQWERIRGQAPGPRTVASQPALTDTGIWMLIVAQHLGLALAVFQFITTISSRFWIRLGLALLWASNALFYTFAHCLGSETLGMILIVLLATQAARLVQHPGEPAWRNWYSFAVILLLCLLARDLNLGLVALLPFAFFVSWMWTRARRHLGHAAIAIAVSVACVLVARSVPQELARKTRLAPHSRIGFTFLWRLHLLSDLSPEARTALLQRIKARTDSESVRRLLTLLEQMHVERADVLNTLPFLERAIPYFGGSFHWADLDRALNQMAFAFLWPPAPEVLQAARTDFFIGLKVPPTLISEYLFETTSYYFQHKDEMPACARLAEFRDDANENWIRQLPFQKTYFRIWKPINYLSAFLFWCGVLIAFLVAARRRAVSAGPVLGLSMALTGIGLLLFVASCVLHDFEPRFGLSMWLLLCCSFFLLIAHLGHTLSHKESVTG